MHTGSRESSRRTAFSLGGIDNGDWATECANERPRERTRKKDGFGGESIQQQSATRRHRVTAPRPDLPARFRAPTIRTTAAEAAATAAAACSLGTRFVDREASPANLAGVQI